MRETAYLARRGEIEEYFDRTAADAWARLTSDVPVSGIRKTVREGRDTMRALIGSWVAPQQGVTVLDAGCGTGLLATDLARAGAIVTAVDLSPTLVELARQRMPADLPAGCITYHAGDMLEQGLGEFDHLVAMDSLIHYGPHEAVSALEAIAPRVRRSMVVTFAPSNPLLMLMMWAARLFPREPWLARLEHSLSGVPRVMPRDGAPASPHCCGHEACPVSTGGGTRRVQSVRWEGRSVSG